MARRKRRVFTSAYNAEVVDVIRASGQSIGAVARDLGPTETAVSDWVQQAEVDGGRGPSGALTTAEPEELTQLRRRVKTLETERDMLKEATAFFAMESERGSDLWRRRRTTIRR